MADNRLTTEETVQLRRSSRDLPPTPPESLDGTKYDYPLPPASVRRPPCCQSPNLCCCQVSHSQYPHSPLPCASSTPQSRSPRMQEQPPARLDCLSRLPACLHQVPILHSLTHRRSDIPVFFGPSAASSFYTYKHTGLIFCCCFRTGSLIIPGIFLSQLVCGLASRQNGFLQGSQG